MIFVNTLIINLFLITAVHMEHQQDFTDFFADYQTYDYIHSYLWQLYKKYPKRITLINSGNSHEGRSILAIKISANPLDENRPMILISAGMHAREWLSVSTALYLIDQLVKNEHMIQKVDWLIVPIYNPDGYVYTHKKDRLWRKNRYAGYKCDGVDLNRNFGFQWGHKGGSINECSINYRGLHPFSEPETQAFRDLALKYQKNIKLYLDLHTYGYRIMYPWGYTANRLPRKSLSTHKYIGEQVSEAIRSIRRTTYTVMSQSSLYIASGISSDWMVAVIKVPLSFVIEISSGINGFKTKKSEILPTGIEMYEGFKVFHKYVEKFWARNSSKIRSRN